MLCVFPVEGREILGTSPQLTLAFLSNRAQFGWPVYYDRLTAGHPVQAGAVLQNFF